MARYSCTCHFAGEVAVLDEMAHNYGGSGMEELKVFLKD